MSKSKFITCLHGCPVEQVCLKCAKLTADAEAEKETIRRDPELREVAKQMRRIGKAIHEGRSK